MSSILPSILLVSSCTLLSLATGCGNSQDGSLVGGTAEEIQAFEKQQAIDAAKTLETTVLPGPDGGI